MITWSVAEYLIHVNPQNLRLTEKFKPPLPPYPLPLPPSFFFYVVDVSQIACAPESQH